MLTTQQEDPNRKVEVIALRPFVAGPAKKTAKGFEAQVCRPERDVKGKKTKADRATVTLPMARRLVHQGRAKLVNEEDLEDAGNAGSVVARG